MLVLSVMVCGTNTTAYAATKSISVKTTKSTLYILDSANNKAKLTVTCNGKNVTKAAKYKSSNSKIAKVNKNGTITAVRPGTVKITTKYKGKSRTTKITIMLVLSVMVCDSGTTVLLTDLRTIFEDFQSCSQIR